MNSQCACGQPKWSDCRRCYTCLKAWSGLYVSSSAGGGELRESELELIGLLPRWEIDPRSLPGYKALAKAEQVEAEEEARLAGLRGVLDIDTDLLPEKA